MARLPGAELIRPRATRFGNILRTLNHTYVIEQVFRAHIEGSPAAMKRASLGADRSHTVTLDVSEREAVAQLASLPPGFDEIDVLVNNAKR